MWRNEKTRFFYDLYSDKALVFDQSERAPGPIYIINNYTERARDDLLERVNNFNTEYFTII